MKMISRKEEEARHQKALAELAENEVIIGTKAEAVEAEEHQHQWTLALIAERESAVRRFAAMKRRVTVDFNKTVEGLTWWPGGFPLATKVDGKYKGIDQYTDDDMSKIRIDQAKYHQAEAIRDDKMTAIEREEAAVLGDIEGRWRGDRWRSGG